MLVGQDYRILSDEAGLASRRALRRGWSLLDVVGDAVEVAGMGAPATAAMVGAGLFFSLPATVLHCSAVGDTEAGGGVRIVAGAEMVEALDVWGW